MMQNRIWPRPVLLPLPEPQIPGRLTIINDGWQICRQPAAEPWQTEENCWEDVQVPCQQPLSPEPFAYRKKISIPREWAGMRVFLRFDGVNCEASVYIGNVFVAGHYGGFVSWNCEITEYADPSSPVWLTVLVRDDPGGICPFHFGGIIRDVTLFAVPTVYISRFHAKTAFDSLYRSAVLTVIARVSGGDGVLRLYLTDPDGNRRFLGTAAAAGEEDIEVSFPVENPRKWDSEHPNLYRLEGELVHTEAAMQRPDWAEDPPASELVCRNIGFRVLERRGNRVFLNGQVLKLRGVNHHDIHPLTGKAITREQAEEDVRLFKEANINFIRTSHYPPRPDFLDFCDAYGIYVEDETAVAFLGQGVDCRENDPAFTDKFMNQFAELIERDYSHPSVIIWSLSNECFWGKNLALENAYAHSEDPGRLTIFSYPITQKETDERADLWSMHYAGWEQPADDLVDSFNRSRVEAAEWPVLHDESTHIPCYARNDLRRDPGIRDFYGETISRFWDKLWETQGALGCAIWAGIDDVWKESRRALAWGILDAWRRRKPEYWHVRKAFAPVRVTGFQAEEDGFLLTLENRFNHTNLSEIRIDWKINPGNSVSCPARAESAPQDAAPLCGSAAGPDTKPREAGVLTVRAQLPRHGFLSLTFTDASGYVVQEEQIDLSVDRKAGNCRSAGVLLPGSCRQSEKDDPREGIAGAEIPVYGSAKPETEANQENKPQKGVTGTGIPVCGTAESEAEVDLKERMPGAGNPDSGSASLHLEETASSVLIAGEHFSLEISKKTGQIVEGKVNGVPVVTGGPALQLTGLPLPPWEAEKVSCHPERNAVRVSIAGHYGKIRVCFILDICGNGRMDVSCELTDMPYASPRKLAMRIGDDTDSGGYEELGIRFAVPHTVKELFWRKQGLWSVYPDWHIGRLSGKAPVFPEREITDGTPCQTANRACRTAPSRPTEKPNGAADRIPGLFEKPSVPWKDDLTDPILFGQYDLPFGGSRDLRSMKSGLLCGGTGFGTGLPAFFAFSDGSHSLRLARNENPECVVNDRDPALVYTGTWYREDTGFASLAGTESWSQTAGDTCSCTFSGTGIAWYSSFDILGGIAEVWLDGRLADPEISLGVRLLTPGIARGYEKDPNRLVYSVTGLEPGTHTLTVRVTGRRAPGSMGSYVFIDHFLVLRENGEGFDGDPSLIIDCAYNYPELS